MKIYIINLEKDKQRKEFQEKQMEQLNLPYQFITAVSSEEIDPKFIRKHYYDWERPLKNPEIACYLSHKKIWEKIVKTKETSIILEDDILLSSNTKNILEELSKLSNFYYINLENVGRKKFLSKKPIYRSKKNLFNLYTLILDKNGSGAYILSPEGAKKLLNFEKKRGIALADSYIKSCFRGNGIQIEPAVGIQLSEAYKFDIKAPLKTTSNTYLVKKKKMSRFEWGYFKVKRIKNEFKLLGFIIKYFFKTKKRKIKTIKEDFIS